MKVSIIGSGNVAFHLAKIFTDKKINLLEVRSRNIDAGSEISSRFKIVFSNDITSVHPDAEIVILAVSDDAIEPIASELTKTNAIVAHTSGMESISKLAVCSDNFGSFYPLQTFTKNREVNFNSIPVLIDGANENVKTKLFELAQIISNQVSFLEDKKRSELHLAAVLVNNFTNHLFALSEKYSNDKELNFNLLKPLMKETVEKAIADSPYKIQTGPAKRNDQKTIEKHLSLIEDEKLKQLYMLFTQSIQNTYG
jgi:predicted short-subunit dehydrogenase-like oxidoreductase (DUF2520 family)